MSFLKTGAAAHNELAKNDLESFSTFRFFMKKADPAETLTFLDGDVQGGLLQTVSLYEHMIPKANGKGFDNIPCTKEQEVCPVCEEPKQYPAMVFAFTVIRHKEYKDNKGTVHPYQKRLYVCKKEMFKRLQSKAIDRGGLTGVTFKVQRIGEKSAGVGDEYDFVSKVAIQDIANYFKQPIADFAPLDYSKEFTYIPAAELRKRGFGSGGKTSGTVIGAADSNPFAGAKPLEAASGGGGSPFGNGGGTPFVGSPFGNTENKTPKSTDISNLFNPAKEF